MGRRPTRRPALEPYQRDLARLIHAELDRGQRADKPPEQWSPWTHGAFAETMGKTANAIANWRNQATLHPPDNIIPLLNTFYGDDTRYAVQRLAMLRLWRQARGYDIDDAPLPPPVLTPTHSESFQGPVELVDLRAHPVPANDGTVRLNASLTISPDDSVAFQGRAVSIGLTEALLTLQSANWQPAHLSMIGEKPHDNVTRIAPGSRITGPRDALGRLNGQPLGEEPVAIIERVGGKRLTISASGTAGEEPGAIIERVGPEDGRVTLTIRAPRGSFDVRTRASPDAPVPIERAVSDTQKIILDALFQEQLTNHDERRAAILAQVVLNVPEKIG